jgi:hypothetical protein
MQEIEGKSLEEVTEYSRVFWERYKELHESEKVGEWCQLKLFGSWVLLRVSVCAAVAQML